MKTNDLLDDLTRPASGEIDSLVAAARIATRRRRTIRSTAITTLVALVLAGSWESWHTTPTRSTNPHPPTATAYPATQPIPLTSDELLESFGDRPVALVTHPDGSQQLLTILRP